MLTHSTRCLQIANIYGRFLTWPLQRVGFFCKRRRTVLLIFADGRGRILKKSRRHLDFQNRVWPDCCGREKDEREHFPLFLPTFWVGVLAGFPGNVGFANTVRLALAALPYWWKAYANPLVRRAFTSLYADSILIHHCGSSHNTSIPMDHNIDH